MKNKNHMKIFKKVVLQWFHMYPKKTTYPTVIKTLAP